jgi:hypothetical protein
MDAAQRSRAESASRDRSRAFVGLNPEKE